MKETVVGKIEFEPKRDKTATELQREVATDFIFRMIEIKSSRSCEEGYFLPKFDYELLKNRYMK